MELSVYDVIKGIITTTKSTKMRANEGKITFRVHSQANKVMVRDAVEKIWDIKVSAVNIIKLKGKVKTIRRNTYHRPDIKKAIVTLKPGYKIDLPDQYERIGLGETAKQEEK